ncbi:hypothetical protein [Streptomyces sp. NPDC088258]|uniref:hypothetical protein n=1 Tax=Streptomyces sp. NPDC088258 TaxID=3365849 RepID=UPI00380831DB
MSPHLRLAVSADLDAYEADRRIVADLQSRYVFALEAWDALEIARIEALAADHDQRHPGEPAILDGLDTPRYLAAA